MWTTLSAVVALACVLASARRLAWACGFDGLDPVLLLAALREPGDVRPLSLSLASRDDAPWESELLRAGCLPDAAAREGAIAEQVIELDWRRQRWARVPRVCASVASSAGFLFASIALLRGLAGAAQGTADPGAALVSALDALAVGMAAACFCVAAHLHARRAMGERLKATGRMVERLQFLGAAKPSPS